MVMDLFTCCGKEEIKLLLSIFMKFIIVFLSDKVLLASELNYVFKKDGDRNSNAETIYICNCFHISPNLIMFFFPAN